MNHNLKFNSDHDLSRPTFKKHFRISIRHNPNLIDLIRRPAVSLLKLHIIIPDQMGQHDLELRGCKVAALEIPEC